MKKTLLLTIFLALNPLNADTINMSEQEMINEIMKMEKQIQAENKKQKQARAKTVKKRKELEDVKKLSRTVDKLAKKLGVDN